MEISVIVCYIVMSLNTHFRTDEALKQYSEAIKITEERRESYICTVSNILSEYLQRNGLGVILLFSIDYPTVCRENRKKTGQNLICKMNYKLKYQDKPLKQRVKPNIYLLMSANHLSLSSSELKKSKEDINQRKSF